MPRKSATAANLAIIPGTPPPRLRPPPELSAIERKIFNDIVNNTKPQHFQPSDMVLLTAYCRAAALERSSAKALNAGTGKDKKEALSRWTQAGKQMVMLSLRLRLSPQARQPNNPSRPQGPQRPPSYYDRHLDGDTDV
jgi:hypothetical protein